MFAEIGPYLVFIGLVVAGTAVSIYVWYSIWKTDDE